MSIVMPGEFPVCCLGAIAVIICPAEIDVANASALAAALRAAGRTAATVVVDMTDTAFCDCSVLGVLVPARQQAAKRGGEVRLVIRSAGVRRLFTITGLDGAFARYPGLAEAIEPPRPASPAARRDHHGNPGADDRFASGHGGSGPW